MNGPVKTDYFKGSNDVVNYSFGGLAPRVLGELAIWLGFWLTTQVKVTWSYFLDEKAEAGETIPDVRAII